MKKKIRFYLCNSELTLKQQVNEPDKQFIKNSGADFNNATFGITLNLLDNQVIVFAQFVNKCNHQYNVQTKCTFDNIKKLNPKAAYSANIFSLCKNADQQYDYLIKALKLAKHILDSIHYIDTKNKISNMIKTLAINTSKPDDFYVKYASNNYIYASTYIVENIIEIAINNIDFMNGDSDEFDKKPVRFETDYFVRDCSKIAEILPVKLSEADQD